MRKRSEYLQINNELKELYLGLFDKKRISELIESHNKIIYGYITFLWPEDEIEGYDVVQARNLIKKDELTSEYLDDIDDDESLGILIDKSYDSYGIKIPNMFKEFTMIVNAQSNYVYELYING